MRAARVDRRVAGPGDAPPPESEGPPEGGPSHLSDRGPWRTALDRGVSRRGAPRRPGSRTRSGRTAE